MNAVFHNFNLITYLNNIDIKSGARFDQIEGFNGNILCQLLPGVLLQ
jgi:hypothetical protein